MAKRVSCRCNAAGRQAWGATVSVNGTFHFLDNRSSNSINLPSGLRQQFGAINVVPSAGTTGTATQGGATVQLQFTPLDTLPNYFVASRPAGPARDGSCTLNFTNGGNTTLASTPTIAGATIIDFASALSMTGGSAPTFNWTRPSGTFDTQRILIRDTTDLRGTGGVGGAGVANVVFSKDIGPTATSFTVNPSDPGFTQQLTAGRLYSFELEIRDLRNPGGGVGLPNIP